MFQNKVEIPNISQSGEQHDCRESTGSSRECPRPLGDLRFRSRQCCSIYQNHELGVLASAPPRSLPKQWQRMNPQSHVENDGSSRQKNAALNEWERGWGDGEGETEREGEQPLPWAENDKSIL